MTASEELARLRRAILLADLIQASGISSQEAAMAVAMSAYNDKPHEFWCTAADSLRQMGYDFRGLPSDETQRAAIRLLNAREDMATRMKGATR